jgi:MFS transporter, Spinster family, sphingosine-1-phosphate transporter
LSSTVGYLLAGWWNAMYGWRVMFMLLGIPGLALAAVAWFTLREPRLATSAGKANTSSAAQPSMKEVCLTLSSNATFRHLLVCLVGLLFFNFGIGQWQPTFFIRSYGLQTGTIGLWLAGVFGLGGLVGAYLGGYWASHHAVHNERLQLRVMASVVCGSGMLSTIAYLSPGPYRAFGLIGVFAMGMSALNGPLFATMQTLVPERMRAVSFALAYLVANLIGVGFGPLAVGALSDALRPWATGESIRYALLFLSPGYLWVGWHLWRASKTVIRDLTRAHELR